MDKKIYEKEEIIGAVKEILEEHGIIIGEDLASEIYDIVTINYNDALEARKTKEISAMESIRKINLEMGGILDSDLFSKIEIFDSGVKVLLIINGHLDSSSYHVVIETAEKFRDFFGRENVMIIADYMMKCFFEPKDPKLFSILTTSFPEFFSRTSSDVNS